MKKSIVGLCVLCLMLLAADSQAVDFKIKGCWMYGVAATDMNMLKGYRDASGQHLSTKYSDYLQGSQRLRTIFQAVVSEALSGEFELQMGTPAALWGKANGLNGGAALGADSTDGIVLRRGCIDWMPPDIDVKISMGIIGFSLPYTAGDAAILQTNLPGVTASTNITKNVGVTAFWIRPLNDNYLGQGESHRDAGYLDNMDLIGLSLPLEWDGVKLTPWAMYGFRGRNAMDGLRGYNGGNTFITVDGNLNFTFLPYPGLTGRGNIGGTANTYGNMFWAGIPIEVKAFAPWNFELDINYGYVKGLGRFDAVKYVGPDHRTPQVKRSSTKREGWLAKALLEYKFDWGTPGILGWYSSGDASDPKNGSGRIPTIVGWGNFTSFMGDGGRHTWRLRDINSTYTGTWGIGAQVKNISFIEDLTHDARVVYWGGTNAPGMTKYMKNAYVWQDGMYQYEGPYMTTKDGLLEFNLDTNYHIYENLDINLTLGYVANYMDNATWNKAGMHDTTFSRQDIWKAHLVVEYSF